jgi:predicted RNase H-like HicB family nuclease
MRSFLVRYDLEDDGRVIAEIADLPGCLVYGATREEARRKVIALALTVIAELVEHGEWEGGDLPSVGFSEAA